MIMKIQLTIYEIFLILKLGYSAEMRRTRESHLVLSHSVHLLLQWPSILRQSLDRGFGGGVRKNFAREL